ncbi:MAG: sigma-70 family RNA polymerase sigma factor [Bacteroidetes bacterium]|jgi:RNA polymerase sigma-70 factor (ECF subfamily)|nr:sigma-70 family RNA polymerase sigma factor [Bacteroidota bacterium]
MQIQHLIQQCKQQNITAQKCLYDMLCNQMFLLCRRYVKNDEIAEELMMNGFLQTFKSLHNFTYRDDNSTIAFIKKIMVNECLQLLRKNQNFLMIALDDADNISINDTVFEKISVEEIYYFITQLPSGYKTIFNLYAIEGYTHKEIALMLQITEGTSKSQLHKAKLMLQELIIKNNNLYEDRKSK